MKEKPNTYQALNNQGLYIQYGKFQKKTIVILLEIKQFSKYQNFALIPET